MGVEPEPPPAKRPGTAAEAAHRLEALARVVRMLGDAEMAARLAALEMLRTARETRIAVVGASGTGKSAWINRAVLSEDLLPAGMPTVVPTEIRQGPGRRLEIHPYLERSGPPAPGATTALSACGGPPTVIADPSPAEIRRHTTAPTGSARARMAAATARVRILLPHPGLAGITLVDTPGLGPLTRASVAVRYRILPACDRILFAAQGPDLTPAERAFLDGPALAGRNLLRRSPGEPWPEPAKLAAGGADGEWTPSLAGMIDRVRTRCAVELAVREAAGPGRFLEDLQRLEGSARLRQIEVSAGLSAELDALSARAAEALGEGIDGVLAGDATGGRSLGVLVRDLESAVAGCAAHLTAEVDRIARRTESEVLAVAAPLTDRLRRELGPGAVPQPGEALRGSIMAGIARSGINPFGLLADILPGIVGPAPPSPAAFAQWRRRVRTDMPRRVEALFRPITEVLPAEWDDAASSRLAAVRQGISAAAVRPDDPDRRARLREALAALAELDQTASPQPGGDRHHTEQE